MTAHGPQRVAARSADSPIRVWPGEPYPLGATWNGLGVNFAIFSEHATRVDLCLFDSPEATVESERIPLPEQTAHGLARLPAGRPAGPALRVSRPRTLRAANGHRFNPNKVVHRSVRKGDRAPDHVGRRDVRLHDRATAGGPGRSTRGTARRSPRLPRSSIRRSPGATTAGRARRGTRPSSTRCTSRLLEAADPACPKRMRGTYEALTTEPAISHLLKLGVTAVELMPVHHHAHDRHLVERGLTNYWGYNTLAFFAPERPLRGRRKPRRHGARVQADGARAARRRPRSHPRRRVQPHGRRQPPRADAVAAAASTTARTTGCWRRTPATTSTSPAAATR